MAKTQFLIVTIFKILINGNRFLKHANCIQKKKFTTFLEKLSTLTISEPVFTPKPKKHAFYITVVTGWLFVTNFSCLKDIK